MSDTADLETNIQDDRDGIGTVLDIDGLRRALFRSIETDVTVG